MASLSECCSQGQARRKLHGRRHCRPELLLFGVLALITTNLPFLITARGGGGGGGSVSPAKWVRQRRAPTSAFVSHSLSFPQRVRLPNFVTTKRATSSDASAWDASSSDENSDSDSDSDSAMPWTERQEWALNDALPKFTLHIRRSAEEPPQTYALWRRMISEVVELSGYPVDFVRQQCASQPPPALMPYLTDFSFESQGGIRGTIVGLEGVADYTTVQTSELRQVETTVPLGYVCTANGNALYELGTPAVLSSSRLADVVEKDRATRSRELLLQRQGRMNGNQTKAGATTMARFMNAFVRTTLVLGGAATVVDLLSHHLTVNVFWV